MSDTTDDMEDYAYQLEAEREKEIENARQYWLMKDGREIKITKMSDGHLLHTIKMLERQNHTDNPSYVSLIKKANERGIQ